MTERGLLLVMMDLAGQEFEDDFNRWYNEEHIPERLACPGFVGAQRYRDATNPLSYLALYHLDSVAALETPFYKGQLQHPTPWTERTQSYRTAVRRVYTEIPITP